jgi:hypothetical protein
MANICEGAPVETQSIVTQTIVTQTIEQPDESSAPEVEDIGGKAQDVREKAERMRQLQALQLMRARIREQLSRSGNERYTLLLHTELQQIESDLAKLA